MKKSSIKKPLSELQAIEAASCDYWNVQQAWNNSSYPTITYAQMNKMLGAIIINNKLPKWFRNKAATLQKEIIVNKAPSKRIAKLRPTTHSVINLR